MSGVPASVNTDSSAFTSFISPNKLGMHSKLDHLSKLTFHCKMKFLYIRGVNRVALHRCQSGNCKLVLVSSADDTEKIHLFYVPFGGNVDGKSLSLYNVLVRICRLPE